MRKTWRTLLFAGILGAALLQPFDNVVAATKKMNEKEFEATLNEEEKKAFEMTKKYQKTLMDSDIDIPYPQKYFDLTKKSIQRSQSGLVRANVIPISYDSREHGVETPVKNQGLLGTCWAHAILDAAQAGYIKNSGKALDLSEWQMAYFAYQQPVDLLSLTEGDTVTRIDEQTGKVLELGSSEYYEGGNRWFSMFSLAKGIGIAEESDASYSELMKTINQNGKAFLNEDKAYLANDYRLESVDIVSVQQTELLKQMIMQYGAGAISYQSDAECYDYGEFNYYNPESSGAGHTVSIVGWDDNYPREKFIYEPEHDGAWLIKNSWGEQWGNDGYFWMSYDESSIQNESVAFFSIEDDDQYENEYQYDGAMGLEVTPAGQYSKMANIFTARKKDEQLKAVSFFTVENDTDYEVTVYTDLQEEENPESGTMVATLSGSKPLPGYCTLDLEEVVPLTQGECFAVVVKQQVKGNNTRMYIDCDADYSWVYSQCKAKKGESFLYGEDGWTDISADGETNVRIKAFTTDGNETDAGELRFEQERYSVTANCSQQLNILSDEEVVNDQLKLTFQVEDSLIASVDGMGRVYGKTNGVTKVVAFCGEDKAECTVVVKEEPITRLIKEDNYATADMPFAAKVGQVVTFPYKKEPVYGAGAVEWKVTDGNMAVQGESSAILKENGTFTATKPGSYVITATAASGAFVQYYVEASLDITDCSTDISLMQSQHPYGKNEVKVYTYKGSLKEKPLKIHFSKDSKLQKKNSYVYLFEGTTEVEEAISEYLLSDYEYGYGYMYADSLIGSYTDVELSDQTFYVSSRSFSIVLITKDEGDTEYGFDVDSVEKVKPLTYLKYEQSQYVWSVGDENVQLLPETEPADANEEIEYISSKPSVVEVNRNGSVTIKKAGTATITAQGAYGELETRTEVVIQESDTFEEISFTQDAITMERNEELDLAFQQPVEGYDVTYSSSAPGKVSVDKNGHIIAAGVINDAMITAEVTMNGKLCQAITHVTVNAPESMEVTDMQSVHTYVEGMDEYYTYVASEDTKGIRLYFDEKSRLKCSEDYIEVLDGNQNVIRKWPDENEWDEFGGQSVTVPGKIAQIHYVTHTEEEEEDSDYELRSREVETEAGMQRYGFRVKRIVTGNIAEKIELSDITLDLTEYTKDSARLKAILSPSDAIDNVTYTVENESVATIGYNGLLYAITNGVTKVTAMTDSGLQATAVVTIKGIPMTSLSVEDNGNKVEKITMTGEEDISYSIITEPSNQTEKIIVESSDESVAYGYINDDGRLYIGAYHGGDTVLTLKTPSGSCSQEILVHVNPKNPGKKYNISNCNDFSEYSDGNNGIPAEQMTVEKLQSAHPYESNCVIVWSYRKPGAESVTLTFDDKTYFEEDYDKLYVYTYEGKGIGGYTHDSLMNQSITIPDCGFRLVLVSDEGMECYGFALKDLTVKMKDGTTNQDAGNEESGTSTIPDSGKQEQSDVQILDSGNQTTTQPGTQMPDAGIQEKTVGTVVTSSNAQYKITAQAGNATGTVTFVKSIQDKKKLTSLTIPASITIDGKTYNVTAIEKNACKKYAKLKKVVIGKNVKSVGANAFAGCKALKNVKIQTTLLTKKTIGKKAFSGIHKKAVIKVPTKKIKEYQKALYGKGTSKSVKIK